MTTRDEIETAIDDLADNAHAIGWNHRHADETTPYVDRVKALLSPARPDGDVTIGGERLAALEAVAETARKLTNATGICVDYGRLQAFNRNHRKLQEALAALDAAAHDRPGGEEATA